MELESDPIDTCAFSIALSSLQSCARNRSRMVLGGVLLGCDERRVRRKGGYVKSTGIEGEIEVGALETESARRACLPACSTAREVAMEWRWAGCYWAAMKGACGGERAVVQSREIEGEIEVEQSELENQA